MALRPNTVAAADYPIVQKPTLGGETVLKLSGKVAYELGTVEITGANTATFSQDLTGKAQLAVDARDVICVVENAVGDLVADVVITMMTKDNTGTPVNMSGVATIKVPGYARVTDRVFQVGYGVALEPQTAAKMYTEITSLVGVTANVAAKGLKVSFFAMPDVGTFVNVGCKTELDYETKSRIPMNIACGMDGSAFTKPGRTSPGEMNATAKYIGPADGLARFDGQRCIMVAETRKEDKLVTDYTYFIGFIGKIKVNSPDGESEATLSVQGKYEDLAIVPAPTA